MRKAMSNKETMQSIPVPNTLPTAI